MSLTNCRFYEEKYPDIDSFVMVNVSALCCYNIIALTDMQYRLNRSAILFCPLDPEDLGLWKEDLDRGDGSICQATRI